MAISEQSRHELHRKLEEFLGPKEAATLMEHLPPRGWGDVTTKADFERLAAVTKREVEQLAALTKGEIEQLAALTKHDMEAMELRLGGRIEISQREVTATLYKELAANTRTVVFACIGAIMTSSGLAFAAARF